MCASARSALDESGITITSVTSVLAPVDSILNWSRPTVDIDEQLVIAPRQQTAMLLVIGQVATRGRSITPIFFEIRFKEEMKMNRFESIKNPLMWSVALLLTAVVVGCGGTDPILGGGGKGTLGGAGAGGGPTAGAANLLGLAAPFGIASTAGITNTGASTIYGDVVLDPNATCNAVTINNAGGFGLCGGSPPTITGKVISLLYPDAGLTSGAVKADLLAGFLSITPPAGPPAAGTLGGATPIAAGTTLGTGSTGQNTFTPGVYQSITSIKIWGDLTLTGTANDVFVFQSSSTLTTDIGARIILSGGVKASNVWWQVGSSATLLANTVFNGNILASESITLNTGATSCGRMLSGAFTAGAIVLDNNVVSVPGNPANTACQ